MSRRRSYPGSIEKRGSSYRIRFSVAGERYYFTLSNVTRKEVERYARDKHRELERLAKRKRVGLPGQVRISELFDQFEGEHLPGLAPRTQQSYRDSLKPLRVYFVDAMKDPRLDEVMPGHVRAYLKWRRNRGPKGQRRKKPLTNRSLQLDRSVLHKAFSIAVSVECVDRNPVSAVPSPRPETRDPVILTNAELERLLVKCGDRDMLRLFVLLLAETGLRPESEGLWVRWQDIDFEGRS